MMSAAIVAADGVTDLRRRAWDAVGRRIAAMDRMDVGAIRRGQALSLLCIDQSSLAALAPLYQETEGQPQVRQAPELRDLIEELIPAVSPRHGKGLRDLGEDLGILLHELFSNTHHHGRVDARGKFYKRSVRGVTFAERAVPIAELGRKGEGWTEMGEYLRLVAKASRSDHNVRLFEMSVVDGGPGMAAHAAGEDIASDVDLATEQALVQRCFAPNETRRAKAGFGMGLPRVMRVIRRRGGLIRVRTGRLSLTRFFDPGRAEPEAQPTEAEARLLDSRSLAEVAAPRGRAAGTVVTVLVPIGLGPR